MALPDVPNRLADAPVAPATTPPPPRGGGSPLGGRPLESPPGPLFSAGEADELIVWLEGLRQRKHLTHTGFARGVLKVEPSVWSKVLRGRRRLSQDVVERLIATVPGTLERYGRSVRAKAARDGAARDGAAQDGAAQDGAAQDGAAQDGAAA